MRVFLALLVFWPFTTLAATVESPVVAPAQHDFEPASEWSISKAATMAILVQSEPEGFVVSPLPEGFVVSPLPQALITPERPRSLALELAMIQTNRRSLGEPRGDLMDVPAAFIVLILALSLLTAARRPQ